MSKCIEIVNAMAQEDQESLLTKLDRYQAMGVPPEKAQKMAAKDLMAELKSEENEFLKAASEQHPDADSITGEKDEEDWSYAASGRAGDGPAEDGGPDGKTPSYGTPREGSVSAVGYHFSKQPRKNTNTSYYGQGLKGAEMARLAGRENDDIRPRTFFYVNKGNGIMPEAGVGAYGHVVELNNLYDANKDSLRLMHDNPGVNNWERAIMNAGFDGYLADTGATQKFAILIGKQHTAVPVAEVQAPGAKANPKPEPKVNIYATREDGDELVRKPDNEQMLKIVYASKSVKDAAPSFRLQYGDARVLKTEADTANQALEKTGFRFDEVLRSERDQTDTQEFKRWSDGLPVFESFDEAGSDRGVFKLYHATTKDFSEFKPGGLNPRDSGPAIWLATDPNSTAAAWRVGNEAQGFRDGANIMPVYAKLKSPLLLDTKGTLDWARSVYADGEFPQLISQKTIDMLKEDGYDSIIYKHDELFGKNNASQNEVVVFEPTQIKSATGNNGEFDSTNPDIRFSEREKPEPVYTHEVVDPRNGDKVMGKYQSAMAARRGRDRLDDKHGGYRYRVREIGSDRMMFSMRNGTSSWDMYETSKFDDMVYKMQNKMIDVKRVIESITKYVGAVADDLNVYLQEELFHGRAAKRTEDFAHQELEPLMKEIKDAGYQIQDVEEYLHARHAKEANAVIASRDQGMPDGGSGMTNAEADNYMQNLSAHDATQLAAIADKVDAIVAATRQLYVDYGLESQDTVDGWNSMFKHYVPLQREDKEGQMGIGQGFSVKGKETRGRTGSRRKVVDILANIAMQRERLIVRGEKNRVANALVGLAMANPNPDFWSVGAPPSERVYDPKTNSVVERVDPMYKSRENVLVAKVKDGLGGVKEVAVVFNEDDKRAVRMAMALKNLDAGNLEGLLGVSAKITRYFAAVNTQYNPVFGVVNLIRDVQHAMITLDRTPLSKRKGRIARDAVSALAGIYQDMRAVRKGGQATSQWSQLWEDFQNEGGQTGYRQMFATSQDRADELKKALDPDAWLNGKYSKYFTANGTLKVPLSVAKNGATAIFDWLSDYNESMENGVRLAAYKAALDQGMSKKEAASLAKNLTVNFNRKGQIGQQAGAVYAFFNAAVQGTANIGQTLFSMEGGDIKTIRLSATGKKVVYGGMLIGTMQALALAAAGFSDDDPPEFVRNRSLIIPVGGKGYVSIPMPQGFNVLPAMGRHLTEFAIGGFKNPTKRAISIFAIFADAFNPIGNAGMSMQTIAPTALDPLVALSENRDFTGKPIARTNSNKAIPGFTQYKDSATVLGKLIAEGINGVTGGNAYVAGALSPTPDQIDYLLGQVTGGVGRELSKVEQTALGAVHGENTPIYKIPMLGRFYGNAASQEAQGGQFYANVNSLNELETEIKGMRKDGKFAEANALQSSRPDAYLMAQANVAERQIQRLNREKREMVAKGVDRDAVKVKEQQITAVMTRLNQAVEKMKLSQD